MVKISSKWFSYASYGTVMGIISLSYLFGDAASRYFMGFLIHRGVGWRGVFLIAGGTLGFLFLLNLIFLKESRAQLGFAEPEVNPLNLFGVGEKKERGKRPVQPSFSGRCFAAMSSGWFARCRAGQPSFARLSISGRRLIFIKRWDSATPKPPTKAPCSRCWAEFLFCSRDT